MQKIEELYDCRVGSCATHVLAVSVCVCVSVCLCVFVCLLTLNATPDPIGDP